jgi:multidrug resistance efflux pump
MAVTVAEIVSKRNAVDDGAAPAPPSAPVAGADPAKRQALRPRAGPLLITLTTAVTAAILGWAMWDAYMGAPWTRDAAVRASVVMMAPDVSGRIVELRVTDNQYVRKGDLLMVVDPTNYTIAVSQAEASVQQAQASVQTIDAQMNVQQAQISANRAQLEQAQAALVFAQQQASRYQDLARTGSGTIQNAQQFTTQLNQQQASVKSAEAALELAQRQVEAQKAQRLSAGQRLRRRRLSCSRRRRTSNARVFSHRSTAM